MTADVCAIIFLSTPIQEPELQTLRSTALQKDRLLQVNVGVEAPPPLFGISLHLGSCAGHHLVFQVSRIAWVHLGRSVILYCMVCCACVSEELQGGSAGLGRLARADLGVTLLVAQWGLGVTNVSMDGEGLWPCRNMCTWFWSWHLDLWGQSWICVVASPRTVPDGESSSLLRFHL